MIATYPANYIQVAQGSAEWFTMRLGVLGGSKIGDAVRKRKQRGKLKDGEEPKELPELAARKNLRDEMIYEIITGRTWPHYVSEWMERGVELEDMARRGYQLEQDVKVEQMGFILHPRIKMAGASPDGLIGEEGMVEIKCPAENTHWRYIIDGVVPEEYRPQMFWQMACAERQWCDFLSYCPEFPKGLKLFTKRLERDEAIIMEMEEGGVKFLAEVEAAAEEVRTRLKARGIDAHNGQP